MNTKLVQSIKRLEAHYRADDRCSAVFLWGSAGRDDADNFSDVDFGIVVRDEDYSALRAELEEICERACGKLTLWLAEADTEGFCSIAFLYLEDDEVLLYDFMMVSESQLPRHRPRQIEVLLDRGNLFEESPPEPTPKTSAGLQTLLSTYWVYCYLNGKYFKRSDVYKILYVQQVLFQTHMRLLHSLHPTAEWGWWCLDIKRLSKPHQQEMLSYFGTLTPEQVAHALQIEVDTFSRDAQAVCARFGEAYPLAMEQNVRRHLVQMNVLRPEDNKNN